MRLNDEQLESCSFVNVMKRIEADSQYFHHQDHVKEFYCEAIAFIAGLHPNGRIAHLEDINYSCTENNIMMICGPCITNPTPPEECYPADFVDAFVLTNLIGAGTPIYVKEGIF